MSICNLEDFNAEKRVSVKDSLKNPSILSHYTFQHGLRKDKFNVVETTSQLRKFSI